MSTYDNHPCLRIELAGTADVALAEYLEWARHIAIVLSMPVLVLIEDIEHKVTPVSHIKDLIADHMRRKLGALREQFPAG